MAGAAGETRIDRLALRVPGWKEEDAKRLALLVAERLAAAGPLGARRLPAVGVTLPAGGPDDLPALAARVVADLVRQLGARP